MLRQEKLLINCFEFFLQIMRLTKKLSKCQCFLNFAIIRGGPKVGRKKDPEQRQRERGEREEEREGREGRTRYLHLYL